MLSPLAFRCAPLLRHLANHPADGPRAIERSAGIPKANVSRDLKLLASEGLIVEGPPYELTAEGREALAAIARLEAPQAQATETGASGILHRQIWPDPANPRKDFKSAGAIEALGELKASIVRDGLIENLVVRPLAGETTEDGLPAFMLIAGERRWTAVGDAIADELWPADQPIPCSIRDVDEPTARRLALVENLQRRDLKPLEEARAIEELMRLNDASAAEIAGELGFSPRWAQQRVSLLRLPEGLQAQVEAGAMKLEDARDAGSLWDKLPPIKKAELERGAITVAVAKQWLASQPKPISVPAEDWLIALEVYDRALRFPLPKRYEHETAATEVSRAVLDDARAEALRYPSQLLAYAYEIEGADGWGLGRWALRPGYEAQRQLSLKFGQIADEQVRLEALAKLRAEAGAEYPLAFEPGEYVTAWLQGPFEPDATRLAEVAAERDEQVRRDAKEAKRQAEARAQAETKAKAGQSRLTAADGMAARLRAGPSPQRLDPLFAALINDGGKPLPWWAGENAEILDATGEPVLHGWTDRQAPPDTVARVKLMALAVNAAAGLHTPIEPPVPKEPEVAEPAEEDEPAEPVSEQIDLEEAIAATEPDDHELAQPADEGDAELPAFLRRLAGAGEPRATKEA